MRLVPPVLSVQSGYRVYILRRQCNHRVIKLEAECHRQSCLYTVAFFAPQRYTEVGSLETQPGYLSIARLGYSSVLL